LRQRFQCKIFIWEIIPETLEGKQGNNTGKEESQERFIIKQATTKGNWNIIKLGNPGSQCGK